ncbi:hypothetical protein [Roseivirga pacifica]|uniref:hypothetical protein n=1 Tax=Roseivirga pacifica TaxID=1267423 RepID=UPI003BAFEC84
MSIAELKSQLHEAIDNLSNKEQLEAIYALIKNHGQPLNRLTIDEYAAILDESMNQIKNGQFLSQEDVEKEAQNW